jgi:Ring finger domain
MKMIRSLLVGLVLVLLMTYMAYDTFHRLLLQYPQQCKNEAVDHHNDNNHGVVVASSIIVEHIVYAFLVCWCCYSYLTHVPNCHDNMNEPDGRDDSHDDMDGSNSEQDRRAVTMDVATLVPLGTVRIPPKNRQSGHDDGHRDIDIATSCSDRESSTVHVGGHSCQDGPQPSWPDDGVMSATMSSSPFAAAAASKASDGPMIVMAESTIRIDFPLSCHASCPVCLEDYRDGDQVSLGGAYCHHVLHAHCLHQWIITATAMTTRTTRAIETATSHNSNLQAAPATATTCPSCRQNLW